MAQNSQLRRVTRRCCPCAHIPHIPPAGQCLPALSDCAAHDSRSTRSQISGAHTQTHSHTHTNTNTGNTHKIELLRAQLAHSQRRATRHTCDLDAPLARRHVPPRPFHRQGPPDRCCTYSESLARHGARPLERAIRRNTHPDRCCTPETPLSASTRAHKSCGLAK